jgi:transcriptional regulator GlxA family with amidase domain
MAEATWEPLQQFKEDHPDVKLEDELFRQEGEVLWTPSSVVSMLGDTGRSTTHQMHA